MGSVDLGLGLPPFLLFVELDVVPSGVSESLGTVVNGDLHLPSRFWFSLILIDHVPFDMFIFIFNTDTNNNN